MHCERLTTNEKDVMELRDRRTFLHLHTDSSENDLPYPLLSLQRRGMTGKVSR